MHQLPTASSCGSAGGGGGPSSLPLFTGYKVCLSGFSEQDAAACTRIIHSHGGVASRAFTMDTNVLLVGIDDALQAALSWLATSPPSSSGGGGGSSSGALSSSSSSAAESYAMAAQQHGAVLVAAMEARGGGAHVSSSTTATSKLHEAMRRGIPIVRPQWLSECIKGRRVLMPHLPTPTPAVAVPPSAEQGAAAAPPQPPLSVSALPPPVFDGPLFGEKVSTTGLSASMTARIAHRVVMLGGVYSGRLDESVTMLVVDCLAKAKVPVAPNSTLLKEVCTYGLVETPKTRFARDCPTGPYYSRAGPTGSGRSTTNHHHNHHSSSSNSNSNNSNKGIPIVAHQVITEVLLLPGERQALLAKEEAERAAHPHRYNAAAATAANTSNSTSGMPSSSSSSQLWSARQAVAVYNTTELERRYANGSPNPPPAVPPPPPVAAAQPQEAASLQQEGGSGGGGGGSPYSPPPSSSSSATIALFGPGLVGGGTASSGGNSPTNFSPPPPLPLPPPLSMGGGHVGGGGALAAGTPLRPSFAFAPPPPLPSAAGRGTPAPPAMLPLNSGGMTSASAARGFSPLTSSPPQFPILSPTTVLPTPTRQHFNQEGTPLQLGGGGGSPPSHPLVAMPRDGGGGSPLSPLSDSNNSAMLTHFVSSQDAHRNTSTFKDEDGGEGGRGDDDAHPTTPPKEVPAVVGGAISSSSVVRPLVASNPLTPPARDDSPDATAVVMRRHDALPHPPMSPPARVVVGCGGGDASPSSPSPTTSASRRSVGPAHLSSPMKQLGIGSITAASRPPAGINTMLDRGGGVSQQREPIDCSGVRAWLIGFSAAADAKARLMCLRLGITRLPVLSPSLCTHVIVGTQLKPSDDLRLRQWCEAEGFPSNCIVSAQWLDVIAAGVPVGAAVRNGSQPPSLPDNAAADDNATASAAIAAASSLFDAAKVAIAPPLVATNTTSPSSAAAAAGSSSSSALVRYSTVADMDTLGVCRHVFRRRRTDVVGVASNAATVASQKGSVSSAMMGFSSNGRGVGGLSASLSSLMNEVHEASIVTAPPSAVSASASLVGDVDANGVAFGVTNNADAAVPMTAEEEERAMEAAVRRAARRHSVTPTATPTKLRLRSSVTPRAGEKRARSGGPLSSSLPTTPSSHHQFHGQGVVVSPRKSLRDVVNGTPRKRGGSMTPMTAAVGHGRAMVSGVGVGSSSSSSFTAVSASHHRHGSAMLNGSALLSRQSTTVVGTDTTSSNNATAPKPSSSSNGGSGLESAARQLLLRYTSMLPARGGVTVGSASSASASTALLRGVKCSVFAPQSVLMCMGGGAPTYSFINGGAAPTSAAPAATNIAVCLYALVDDTFSAAHRVVAKALLKLGGLGDDALLLRLSGVSKGAIAEAVSEWREDHADLMSEMAMAAMGPTMVAAQTQEGSGGGGPSPPPPMNTAPSPAPSSIRIEVRVVMPHHDEASMGMWGGGGAAGGNSLLRQLPPSLLPPAGGVGGGGVRSNRSTFGASLVTMEWLQLRLAVGRRDALVAPAAASGSASYAANASPTSMACASSPLFGLLQRPAVGPSLAMRGMRLYLVLVLGGGPPTMGGGDASSSTVVTSHAAAAHSVLSGMISRHGGTVVDDCCHLLTDDAGPAAAAAAAQCVRCDLLDAEHVTHVLVVEVDAVAAARSDAAPLLHSAEDWIRNSAAPLANVLFPNAADGDGQCAIKTVDLAWLSSVLAPPPLPSSASHANSDASSPLADAANARANAAAQRGRFLVPSPLPAPFLPPPPLPSRMGADDGGDNAIVSIDGNADLLPPPMLDDADVSARLDASLLRSGLKRKRPAPLLSTATSAEGHGASDDRTAGEGDNDNDGLSHNHHHQHHQRRPQRVYVVSTIPDADNARAALSRLCERHAEGLVAPKRGCNSNSGSNVAANANAVTFAITTEVFYADIIITNDLIWRESVMMALCGGCLLLKPSYVAACEAEGTMVGMAAHEWSEADAPSNTSGAATSASTVSAGAADKASSSSLSSSSGIGKERAKFLEVISAYRHWRDMRLKGEGGGTASSSSHSVSGLVGMPSTMNTTPLRRKGTGALSPSSSSSNALLHLPFSQSLFIILTATSLKKDNGGVANMLLQKGGGTVLGCLDVHLMVEGGAGGGVGHSPTSHSPSSFSNAMSPVANTKNNASTPLSGGGGGGGGGGLMSPLGATQRSHYLVLADAIASLLPRRPHYRRDMARTDLDDDDDDDANHRQQQQAIISTVRLIVTSECLSVYTGLIEEALCVLGERAAGLEQQQQQQGDGGGGGDGGRSPTSRGVPPPPTIPSSTSRRSAVKNNGGPTAITYSLSVYGANYVLLVLSRRASKAKVLAEGRAAIMTSK